MRSFRVRARARSRSFESRKMQSGISRELSLEQQIFFTYEYLICRHSGFDGAERRVERVEVVGFLGTIEAYRSAAFGTG